MQKILFAFTFLFSLSSIAIAQEKSSFEEKVARMLEVSGARQNFDAAILNMVELQKRAYADILSDEFFDELGKEMIKVGFEKLTPEFVPIYKRHLTEEELDEMSINADPSDAVKLKIMQDFCKDAKAPVYGMHAYSDNSAICKAAFYCFTK